MSSTSLQFPVTDPTSIFEHFRGVHATELLTIAVAHLGVFEKLASGPLDPAALQQRLQLADRPFVVLITALRAMGLVAKTASGQFELTQLASEHLVPGGAFDVSGYVGLAAQNPSVLGMLERLKSNRPFGAEPKSEEGTAFIFKEGSTSAMEQEASARRLTLSLAGRARNVAPHLARQLELHDCGFLLDVGGGSGIYSFELLKKHPELRAIVMDGAEVLKVAEECAREWGVAERVEFIEGDMFRDPFPPGLDVVLLSNILHDWDVPQCAELVKKAADALRPGGQVLIHDVFLNDNLDGPLPIALYSASLFSLTEGRAYSAAEYRQWLTDAGLTPETIRPTLVHCGVMSGRKPK